MSRVSKAPVVIPAGVEFKRDGQHVAVKGKKGELLLTVHNTVNFEQEDNILRFSPADKSRSSNAMAGTMRVLVNNMVRGVSEGYEKKLILNGVGYRAKASGKVLNLSVGFSHPIDYELPEGIKADTPSQTEVVISGADKQRVGQVASEIRAFRPPEPYKGKGIRYADEYVRRKETKKK